jgi:hypothetical protein
MLLESLPWVGLLENDGWTDSCDVCASPFPASPRYGLALLCSGVNGLLLGTCCGVVIVSS